jgi:microsomal dipeptidase-like Zn-dependent dipeptidase
MSWVLPNAEKLPALLEELRSFGFDDRELEQFPAGNWRRVLGATGDHGG